MRLSTGFVTDVVWLGESPRGRDGESELASSKSAGKAGGKENPSSGWTRGVVRRCSYFIPELIGPDRVPRAVWRR